MSEADRAKTENQIQPGRINDRGCRCRKAAGEESPGFTGQDAG